MSKFIDPLTDLYSTEYVSIFDSDSKYIPTGYPTLDKFMNDLPTKKVTVVTGVPKEGKSTFLHRIVLHAVDKGKRVLLIDGEHDRDTLINKLYHLVLGNEQNTYDRRKLNKMEFIEPKKHIIKMLREWHKDRLMIFNKYLSPFKTLEDLFEFIDPLIGSKQIDLIVFDNLMMLVEGTSVEKTENQSRFLKRVCDLAKAKNAHCIVVAHPNKKAVAGEPMGIYDVLGASEIVNLVDYLIQIMRVYGDEDEADAYARLILNRTRGRNIGDVPLKFDKMTESLYEMGISGKGILDKFNWKGKGNQIEEFKDDGKETDYLRQFTKP